MNTVMMGLSKKLAIWSTASLLLLCGMSANAEQFITYYHNDILGSPVAATDEDGELLWREVYRPYGTKSENQDGANQIGYTGHNYDKETGLTYMQARYYDSNISRFISVDGVGFIEESSMSFNRYLYANNNPYAYVDPDGNLSVRAGYVNTIYGPRWYYNVRLSTSTIDHHLFEKSPPKVKGGGKAGKVLRHKRAQDKLSEWVNGEWVTAKSGSSVENIIKVDSNLKEFLPERAGVAKTYSETEILNRIKKYFNSDSVSKDEKALFKELYGSDPKRILERARKNWEKSLNAKTPLPGQER